MTRAPLLRRPRPALAGVALLGCLAIALPLLSGPGRGDGTVEATRGYVSAERPIDRILAGTALGSRPIAPAPVSSAPAAAVATARATAPGPEGPPRLVQPDRLAPALPDAEPDLRIAWLSVTAGYPPVDLPAIASAAPEDWTVTPRRKPDRPATMPVIEIAARPLDPVTIILPAVDPAPGIVPIASAPLPAPVPVAGAPAADTDAPRIALVVTAAGLHEATTRQAIRALPGGVTLAFAPVGRYSEALSRSAIADGHTVLVEIPMEPMNPRRDPGRTLTLRTGDPGAANVARLDEALSTVPGASGVSSYLGGRFNRSERDAAPVIDRIAARDLFLFENQPGGQSRLGVLARARDVPYAAAATALDADRNETRMLESLALLEARARREGVAIGVATAYRESVSTLERWVAEAQRRGIVFVPVTRLGETG